jgi:hypothetical protein
MQHSASKARVNALMLAACSRLKMTAANGPALVFCFCNRPQETARRSRGAFDLWHWLSVALTERQEEV